MKYTNTNTDTSHAYCKKCEKITQRFKAKKLTHVGKCKPCKKEQGRNWKRKKLTETNIRDGIAAVYLVKMFSLQTNETFWKIGSSGNVWNRINKLKESGYRVELEKCILLSLGAGWQSC
ncbi:hypothetical protein tloyanaT_03980 [Thalassotalea loyana]|uniref:Uncharacterized protein n=1 Tax=Thalassotalea loyana TaxID=280483 RepID=A0ABQ6H7N2_9GAMM|nr:hypothetical protein [Thalassotalea loyana]GLX84146.1 hypothetical protein tloyanaT_03980 [Thalassotalea loyana]